MNCRTQPLTEYALHCKHIPAWTAVLLFALAGPAFAAPRLPDRDDAILERLPTRANDPVAREVRELRSRLTANPKSLDLALQLARKYFDLAGAEGDPRYVGYAEAIIRPWKNGSAADARVLLMSALIRQYRHEFAPAMQELDEVIRLEPSNTEAILWQFALNLVQADYAGARASCARAAPHSTRLSAIACTAVIDSIGGKSRAAYDALSAAMARYPSADPEYRQWAITRLGEMAQRFGDRILAERHFKEAIATGFVDGFVLAAYADLLIDDKRYAEVIDLLKNWVASDILLVRLAIAETAIGAPLAADHRSALADRFAAAALRGDRLHQQEEARFALDLQKNPARALALAVDNWQHQREPRDALVLMLAARGAEKPAAALPALEWMANTGYEDPRYRALAAELRSKLPAAGTTKAVTPPEKATR